MYPNTPEDIKDLMWAGKQEELQTRYPCQCCCDEHTDTTCPARYWGGCRSGLGPGEDD
jgi:hypothetical protein